MWHDLASSLESTGQLVMFGFVLMGSQHPLATAGIVLLFRPPDCNAGSRDDRRTTCGALNLTSPRESGSSHDAVSRIGAMSLVFTGPVPAQLPNRIVVGKT